MTFCLVLVRDRFYIHFFRPGYCASPTGMSLKWLENKPNSTSKKVLYPNPWRAQDHTRYLRTLIPFLCLWGWFLKERVWHRSCGVIVFATLKNYNARYQKMCVCCLHIEALLLPNLISTLSVRTDSLSLRDTDSVVTDCEPEKKQYLVHQVKYTYPPVCTMSQVRFWLMILLLPPE